MQTRDPDTLIVDSKYKSCPGPIIDLSEASKQAKPGKVIRLLATDPAAPSDVREWADQIGHKFIKSIEHDGYYEIDIEVG